MKKFYLCVAFFSIAVCYGCLFVFRQLPAGELWSGYSVLYVHDSIPEETVFNTLSESGINEVTCLSNQFLPIDLKADSCEVSLIPLNPDSVDYLLKKSNYFFDRSHSYRLYYIPVFYKQKLNQTVQLISKKGFSGNCGIDTKSSYPFLIPLSVFLFSVFLFFYSKKRFLFGSLSLLPLSYSVSFPFLSSALSCFILNLIFYLFSNIYGRSDFINFIFI